ncbi:hypothetical protein [Candidatus Anaplasma sp. TIGMIC]|uniref:hypothetical protein n=1 Tax=Candidatus Anaplasma sp. TIGMIC TaxID=3020713 RepID=UPI00232FD1C6|nr:hypothetical protein [Candidatus Anaplasma sp. TIGMIC]MDB1135434.1 hypothetical protein [Candidatus Anaplasma sp. TIGMIC]
MRRDILALKHQVRALCMLAHAAGACIALLQSLGVLQVAYVGAVVSLILVSTTALCGVLLCTQKRVQEVSADYRGIMSKGQRAEYLVPEKVYGNEIKVLISVVLRDTVAVIASLGLVLALFGGLYGAEQPIPVVTVALRVACVFLILNYAVDAALRTAFLVMGAHSACSRCTASLGEHEHNLLRNVSTSLHASGTADTLLARDWCVCVCVLLHLCSLLLG